MSDCCCEDGDDFRPLQVGEEVPDFTIETYDPAKKDFGEVSLANLREQGKWTILVFYPGDFTFVCTTELVVLGDLYPRFQKMDAEIVSVSCDTKFVHLAWQRDEKSMANIKYPMAADPTGELAALFGVLVEDQGYARRGTFIINPEGQLVAAEVNLDPVGRNMDELMRKFKAFLHVRKNPEKACPAKWKEEGDADLTPGAGLVGKVSEQYNG